MFWQPLLPSVQRLLKTFLFGCWDPSALLLTVKFARLKFLLAYLLTRRGIDVVWWWCMNVDAARDAACSKHAVTGAVRVWIRRTPAEVHCASVWWQHRPTRHWAASSFSVTGWRTARWRTPVYQGFSRQCELHHQLFVNWLPYWHNFYIVLSSFQKALETLLVSRSFNECVIYSNYLWNLSVEWSLQQANFVVCSFSSTCRC